MRRMLSRLAVISTLFVNALECDAKADSSLVEATAHLKRGVNILGYDGVWDGWFGNPFEIEDFRRIRKAGFDHVRVNVFGLKYLNRSNVLDPKILSTLDHIFDLAEANGLWVVLDQHDNSLCQSSPEKCKEPTLTFWRQISARFARARPKVVYEILNEPGGAMTHEQWNDLLRAALALVRRSEPGRIIIVPALNVPEEDAVEKLDIPADDRRLIVTVHYYDPHRFTHQGAPWNSALANVHNVTWGGEAARRKVEEDFEIIARWANAERRPVYLGEFGVLGTAPAISRAAWTRHVARTAEALGWGWAYWQFDHDFALVDPVTREWNRPLLDALMQGEP